MPSTRSSARQAAQKTNSTPSSASQSKPSPATGSKRKAEGGATGKAKKGRKAQAKEQTQTTIEDVMPEVKDSNESKDVEMKDAIESKKEEDSEVKATEPEQKDNGTTGDNAGNGEAATEKEPVAEDSKPDNDAPAEKPEETVTNGNSKDEEEPKKNGFDTLMSASANSGKDTTNDKNATPEGTGSLVPPSANAVEENAHSTPSSILEKGLIYFFFRARVGTSSPSSPTDLARSYIILRPIPHSSSLSSGPIGDHDSSSPNNDSPKARLLALPKKVLPLSPKDRFLLFVEKAHASMSDIKTALSSSDYVTKTAGERHTPAAAPMGEGVYAITETSGGSRGGRGETHLAYILTRPEEVGEVQRGVGLKERGSWVTSAKNPTAAAPGGKGLERGAEYPKE